jgi:hypothetical protein
MEGATTIRKLHRPPAAEPPGGAVEPSDPYELIGTIAPRAAAGRVIHLSPWAADIQSEAENGAPYV